jgi:hypothetical protein
MVVGGFVGNGQVLYLSGMVRKAMVIDQEAEADLIRGGGSLLI